MPPPASALAAGAADAMGPGASTWVLAPQAGRPPTSKASNARGQDRDLGGGRRRHEPRLFFQAPAKGTLLHSPTRGRQRTRSDPNGLTEIYIPFSVKMSRCSSSDLLPEESLALVALSRAIARADGTITPLEGRAIAAMAAELGEATYRKLFAKAAESFPDQAALETFLASIERPEARALIYESILALAAADSISAEEEPLIVWLHETWKIQ